MPSDPFLMNGFGNKCLHISHSDRPPLSVKIQLDFQGTGEWHTCDRTETSNGYTAYTFPRGLSAQWVRLIPGRSCTATAQFYYS